MAGVVTGSSGGVTPRRADRRPAHRSRPLTFHLRLVGGFAATQGGFDIKFPAASRRRVAVTALHAGPIPRHVAAERLWPHLEPRSALSSLRTALFRLNTSHSAMLDTGPGYIALAEHVEVDVHALEAFASRLIDGPVPDDDDEESIRRLTMAILPDCDDDWLRLERDRLRDLFLHAIEAHAARLSAAGHYARALSRRVPRERRIPCGRPQQRRRSQSISRRATGRRRYGPIWTSVSGCARLSMWSLPMSCGL